MFLWFCNYFRIITRSVPFLHQKEIPNIVVLNTGTAHVKLIQRNHILREVVTNVIIRSKLTSNSFLRCQQIDNLNIKLLSTLVAYKVDLLVPASANSYLIAPAQQFKVGDVLKDEIDIPCIAAKDSLTDAVVRNIVFLIGSENLFACKSSRLT